MLVNYKKYHSQAIEHQQFNSAYCYCLGIILANQTGWQDCLNTIKIWLHRLINVIHTCWCKQKHLHLSTVALKVTVKAALHHYAINIYPIIW